MAAQIRDLEKKLKQYSHVEVPRAAAKALNNCLNKTRGQVVKAVAAEEKIPQKYVKGQVFAKKGTAKVLRAYLTSYLRGIMVTRLLSEKTLREKRGKGTNRRGVRAAGRQFDGAFINTVKAKGLTFVMRRLGQARLPVEVLTIPIANAIEKHQLIISQQVLRQDFTRLYLHELNFRLTKYGK